MFQQIEQLLAQFRPCFCRKAAFGWFVTVIVGFMLHGDQLGVTSVIRDLSLSPGCYELLIHFFHSDAWDPELIRKTWWKLLLDRYFLSVPALKVAPAPGFLHNSIYS